jgi:hypothetical protein
VLQSRGTRSQQHARGDDGGVVEAIPVLLVRSNPDLRDERAGPAGPGNDLEPG